MSGDTGATQNSELCDTLRSDIDEFAAEFVENAAYARTRFPKNAKIIHDPLWGTIRLQPWEVALLDLPLFQRLRQIRQTSLVSYVFPGCTHSRFEHTLGVLQQTQRLVDAVNGSCPHEKQWFEPTDVRNLRIAALFHDCGHSCMSHISEHLFARCSDLKAWFASPDGQRCNPHEALSALILLSKPVSTFLTRLEQEYDISLDARLAADWIMGVTDGPRADPKRQYIVQVINGPFDADKLDYIFRDSHYSGIPVGLDLDRLWASCQVKPVGDGGPRMLVMHQASVAPLEQIVFSKTNLFAIVYQHPKVRASECMYQAIVESIQNGSGEAFETSGRKLTFQSAVDFLWFTDDTFFAEALRRKADDPIHKSIHAVRYRRLLVRALTISFDTLADNEAPDTGASYAQLRKLNQKGDATYAARRDLARKIIAEAKLADVLNTADVWVDIPADPRYGEADRTYVVAPSGTPRKVSELFPVHYWTDLFAKYKWRGHVFCPEQHQQAIHEAALRVFHQVYGLRFGRSAGEMSHVRQPKTTDELCKPGPS